jgi:hypothetical protein
VARKYEAVYNNTSFEKNAYFSSVYTFMCLIPVFVEVGVASPLLLFICTVWKSPFLSSTMIALQAATAT